MTADDTPKPTGDASKGSTPKSKPAKGKPAKGKASKEKGKAPPLRPWTVHEVEADVVRPMRLEYLRPGGSAEDVEYVTDNDHSARHFAAKDEKGTVVGIGSMYFENRVAGVAPYGIPGMRVRGMAVANGWRNRGVGADVIRAMVRTGRAAGMVEVWANARTESLGFYQRTRFKAVSNTFVIPKIGEHVVMARSLLKKSKETRRFEKQKSKKPRKPRKDTTGGDAAT